MYRTTFFLRREDRDSPKIIYAVKHCKRPAATKVYKELTNMFNRGEIAAYGWKQH